MLDQLLRSRWFVRIISFMLAVLLFLGITLDSPQSKPSTNPFLTLFSSSKDPKAFEEVDLVSYYDEEKYVVTGLPEKISIYLEGSESLITKAKLATNYEAYVDLNGYKEGTHQVPVMHRNIPGQLTVKTDPEHVTITIEEKVSKLAPVEVQVINESKLPLGYAYETPIVYPNSITVTGAKSQVNKIALIKGYINIAFAKESIDTSVPLFIYDSQGNELKNLDVYPAVIDVRVPITSPYKSVPIRVKEINSLPKGLSLVSITVEPNTVIIYGQKEDIDRYEYIDGKMLNLRTINEDTVFTFDVPVPDKISIVKPEKIKVKVQVAKQEEKTFEDVSIKVKGLSQGLKASFITPSDGVLDVNLLGAQSILEDVTIADFDIFVDLSQLVTGEHIVNIEFNGPQYVKWEAHTFKAKVKITE
ncbi:CdaR family protein [Lottiidibacillus patelloidae]|nr:CdaR family protein [Lottiidibacillus patelloidae]